MTRKVSLYVADIVTYMEKAEAFVEGFDEAAFQSDEKTRFAVVRRLEVIGEAAKHVPEQIREQFPEIPWRDMAGMRDKISHFYFGTDFSKVLLVVKEDIPRLKPSLMKIQEALGNE